MHDRGMCHRDLKMTNILINNKGIVKIIDFGFATESQNKLRMYCGTPSYMPPEMVNKITYYGMPLDVWSLGVVLYKLLTGEYPFGAEKDPELKNNIRNVNLEYPFFITPKCKDLIVRMLKVDPMSRLTISQVFLGF